MVETKDHQTGGEVQGQQALGEPALKRLYQAQDGWLFLQGLKSERDKLKQMSPRQPMFVLSMPRLDWPHLRRN